MSRWYIVVASVWVDHLLLFDAVGKVQDKLGRIYQNEKKRSYTCCGYARHKLGLKKASISATVSFPRFSDVRSIMNSTQILTPEKLIDLPKVGILITSPSGDKAIFSQSVFSSQEKKVRLSFGLLSFNTTTICTYVVSLTRPISVHIDASCY